MQHWVRSVWRNKCTSCGEKCLSCGEKCKAYTWFYDRRVIVLIHTCVRKKSGLVMTETWHILILCQKEEWPCHDRDMAYAYTVPEGRVALSWQGHGIYLYCARRKSGLVRSELGCRPSVCLSVELHSYFVIPCDLSVSEKNPRSLRSETDLRVGRSDMTCNTVWLPTCLAMSNESCRVIVLCVKRWGGGVLCVKDDCVEFVLSLFSVLSLYSCTVRKTEKVPVFL